MPNHLLAEEDCMSHRRLLALAIIAGMPGLAGAQFTTFIPPLNKVADSVKAIAVAQTKVQSDSAVNVQLTNMKTWVDSAAGINPGPATAADSVASAMAPTTTTASVPTARNGRRAPATASVLPTIALIGAITLGLGLCLLAGPQPARHRG
jgi:hypothetical protein